MHYLRRAVLERSSSVGPETPSFWTHATGTLFLTAEGWMKENESGRMVLVELPFADRQKKHVEGKPKVAVRRLRYGTWSRVAHYMDNKTFRHFGRGV